MSKLNQVKGFVQDDGKILIKDTEYTYVYCNTFGLLHFCRRNKPIENSLKKIMLSHRSSGFEIYYFVHEEFLYMNEEIPMTVNYLLIHADNEIVGISRVLYNEKHSIGEISAVHTSPEHRGKKICQANIGKLVELTREKYKIKHFKLDVDTTNKAAIKCYEKNGFKIYGDIKHFKNETEYTMELKFDEDEKSKKIVGGNYHTVLVSDDGQHVWTFGNNEYGQLGHGDKKNRYVPTEVKRRGNEFSEDVRIIDVSCGSFHTVLLSEDGKHIWTFGDNEFGQLGHGDNGDGTNRNVPTEIQRNINNFPEDVRIVSVSCSSDHTVLLSDDGRIWSFGRNDHGQLGHGDMEKRKVPTEIQRNINGLHKDIRIIGVSCGEYHTVLLSDDGRIWTFGYNNCGQLGHGDKLNRNVPTEIHMNKNEFTEDVRIIGASCGYSHTVLLSEDGKHIWTFGRNDLGQLGHGDYKNRNIPTEIQRGINGLLEDIKIIGASCGENHTVLLSDDDRIWNFGWNACSEFGREYDDHRNVPTEIQRREYGLHKDVKIIDVSCGEYYVVLLSGDGRIWTFGDNDSGQLGRGTSECGTYKNVPTEIQDFSLRQLGSLTKSANKT